MCHGIPLDITALRNAFVGAAFLPPAGKVYRKLGRQDAVPTGYSISLLNERQKKGAGLTGKSSYQHLYVFECYL